MHARSLGLLAATAVATNAILLPPDVSSATINADNDLAALGVVDPENQVINVPSGQCVGRDGDCSLVLSISTGGQPKTLLINGVPFYTSNPMVTSSPMNTPVQITQLDSSETVVDYVSNPSSFSSKALLLTGSSFEAGPVEFQAETGEEIIPMNFQIYSLNGQAVNVPLVTLKVLKSVDADLMVLAVAINPVDPMVNPEDKLCNDWPMVCQWRDFLMGKANAAKEGIKKLCGGKTKGMPPPPPPHRGGPPVRLHHPHHFDADGEMEMPPPPPHHGGHRRPFGGHHGHHRHGRHGHHGGLGAASVLMMIVGAVMMLMVTWILGYVIGTIVGYCIVGLWLLYRRMRGTPKYHRVAADEQGAYAEEEKIVVEDSQEQALPKEDPPAYEEKEVVV